MASPSVGMFFALTPIVAGEEIALHAHLVGLPEDDSPLKGVKGTHFARFVIIPELIWEGPRQKPDALKSQYLLFSGCYDLPLNDWLDRLAPGLGDDQVRAIWGRCAGFVDPGGLKYYLLHNQLKDTAVYYWVYSASVERIQESLERQAKLRAFVLSHQGDDDATLQEAWQREFGVLGP